MVRLDASLWLRLADQSEVDALVRAGGRGRDRDAYLIRFFEPLSDELTTLVGYAGEVKSDVCFQVDLEAAGAWIRGHRPQLRCGVGGAGAAVSATGRPPPYDSCRTGSELPPSGLLRSEA